MRTSTKTILICALVAAVGLVVACTSGSSKGSFSVSTRSVGGVAAPAGLTLANGITISRIRMAVRSISVEGGDDDDDPSCLGTTAGTKPPTMPMSTVADHSGSGGGDDGQGEDDDEDRCHFRFGPFDVDVAGSALAGAVAFAFDAPIPPGTYEEVAIDVDTVSSTRAGGNPVLQALAAAHASILIDGFVEPVSTTGTPTPFTFSTPMDVKQKREGKIVIGAGSNVTLTFDPTHWFDGPHGRLDPTDPTAQGTILANIRASIRLVKDDDRDGKDDDDEGHGGGGGGERD